LLHVAAVESSPCHTGRVAEFTGFAAPSLSKPPQFRSRARTPVVATSIGTKQNPVISERLRKPVAVRAKRFRSPRGCINWLAAICLATAESCPASRSNLNSHTGAPERAP
jgi:hypothetical protein